MNGGLSFQFSIHFHFHFLSLLNLAPFYILYTLSLTFDSVLCCHVPATKSFISFLQLPFCDCLYCFIQRFVIFSWPFSSFFRLQSLWMCTKGLCPRKYQRRRDSYLNNSGLFAVPQYSRLFTLTLTLNINSIIRCHK